MVRERRENLRKENANYNYALAKISQNVELGKYRTR